MFGSLVLICFFGMTFMALLPAYAHDVMGGGPLAYGALSSGYGVGSIVGALVVAAGSGPEFLRRIQRLGLLGGGLALLAFSSSGELPLSVGLAGLCGAGLTAAISAANTRTQLLSGDAYRGRVLSLGYTMFWLGLPAGAFVGAAITRAVGVAWAFRMSGVALVLALVVAMGERPRKS